MKRVQIAVLVVHLIVGVGALAGGLAAILDPIEPLGSPVSLLEGSPFSSYLIPGLVLFTLFGIGNMIGALLTLRAHPKHAYLLGVLGGAMMIWIVVQVLVIKAIVFLHILFFCIGLFQVAVLMHDEYRRQLDIHLLLGRSRNSKFDNR
jgi:hypothetical protein